jgi:pimeloyl-ACP methyl ester carboxylesterase
MLAHDRTGSGPPLLLVHGIGMSRAAWRPVVPLLTGEREVIAVDLPGHGASPPGPETVEGLADAVAATADALGLEDWHVAGNSLGGGVALALAAAGRVRTACAVSPIGFAAGREPAYSRGVLSATRFMARGLLPVIGPVAANPALRTALCAHVAARPWRLPREDAVVWTRDYATAASFWPLLRQAPGWHAEPARCPTTIAWGDRDRLLIYSRQAPRARRRLPDARHITLRGCGHVPTWDDPEAVAAAILA